jgi:hypothetical protein
MRVDFLMIFAALIAKLTSRPWFEAGACQSGTVVEQCWHKKSPSITKNREVS